jgi:DNA-binding response OmpR family regulator
MLPRPKILIVEDDEDLRRMFRTTLTLAGFEVTEAGDGLEALTHVDADPPDLVVLDLMLPGVSGVVVYQEIAAHAITRNIPIVVITGSPMIETDLDVACFMRKPISPDRLVEAVRTCLASGSGRSV